MTSNQRTPITQRSQRAKKGNLSTIKKKCPFCGHNKTLISTNITKCSKCKR